MSKLPGTLRLTPSFPFAGRSRELGLLRTMSGGDGDGLRFVLIGGEAGSGKSRLVREFAREAAAGGARVLYGACDSVVRRPYGPFVDALQQLVRSTEPGDLRADLGAEGGELSRLLPDLALLAGELPAPLAADPDTERHRLHTAVAQLLSAASRRTPLVLVIEDAHWADTPTLLLLRHLPHSAAEAQTLVVTTFRDTEAEVPESLSAALVDLRRSEGVVRLRLGGLSAEEVSEFVELGGGQDLGPELPAVAQVLTGLTGGNPFLMTELWRSVLEAGAVSSERDGRQLARAVAELGSPEEVRELVSQRLGRLSPSTTALLELAAVAGPEFELDVLDGSGLERTQLRSALEQAAAHGMIEEVGGRQLGYRFTHELVRRAVYDRMPGIRRAELHLQVAEALERAGGADESRPLAELAHHFAAAAPIDGPSRAIEYSVLAGRAALAALDFDEAQERFSSALDLGIEDPARRAQTYLELGTACFRGGSSSDSMNAYMNAAKTARSLGDAQVLATAAVGYEDACFRPARTAEGSTELLEEASLALGQGDSELRVRLLSGLTRAHAFAGDYGTSAYVEEQAIAMARRLGDQHGLATVLMRSYWTHANSNLEETLGMLSEAREIAAAIGDTDIETEAMEWRVASLIALGDLQAAARELDEVYSLAGRLRQPFMLHVAGTYAATLALCTGRLADADAAAQRSHEWSRLLTGRPAGTYGIQMFGIRREQGRLAELATTIKAFSQRDRPGAAWRPGFAALLAELGMENEVRRELACVRDEGFDELRSTLWVASLSYLTDACAAVGDRSMAELVYPELAPLAGGNIVIGHGVACYGAADRYLGLLAATLGDHARAVDHFEQALARNREMGATTWVAQTMYAYGRTLRMSGSGDDAAQASALLSEAAALAQRIGMPTLLARTRALGARVHDSRSVPEELSEREVEILRLVAAGLSNREIGAQLFISGHTVANHVRSILRKTGAANRTEAAGYAYRNALVEQDRQR